MQWLIKLRVIGLIVTFFTCMLHSDQFTDILDFDSTNGAAPFGTVTISGNVLYGMTSGGGANGAGLIFSINKDGTGYTDLLDFGSLTATGTSPFANLTLSGNKLFGMTLTGGAHGVGCIFSINTDGTGYTQLLDFGSLTATGSTPFGSLTISGNVLFGMTSAGGAQGNGLIFSIHTDGTGYTDLLDFNFANGAAPHGSLTLVGNVLYGMTSEGGANGLGRIFSIHTDGTGYTTLLDFIDAGGGQPLGSAPMGDLMLAGDVLYGMTNMGGANGLGVVFSILTDGTGYTKILDFNNTNGANPVGTVTLSGNTLFGMTDFGGADGAGCIFSVNTDGTGYTDLVDFNFTNGGFPAGSLALSDNLLYGMTSFGGAHFSGNLFSLQIPPPAPTPSNLLPPSNLSLKQKNNDFGLLSEWYNQLKWTASTSEDVIGYVIYRQYLSSPNEPIVFLASTVATSYQDQNQKKGRPVAYSIASVNAQGVQSAFVTISLD